LIFFDLALFLTMDPRLLSPLIHIGYHKTGTTWLQTKLFHQPGKGFISLTNPTVSKNDKRSSDFRVFPRNFIFDSEKNILSLNEFSPERVRGLLERYKLEDSGVPVISFERLSGHPSSGGFDSEKICLRLSQVFDSPKIFIVIREQKSLILSCYSQLFRRGGTLSLKDYICRPGYGTAPKFNKRFFMFNHLISLYQEVFGKENVLVLPYEMFRDEPAKFLERLGSFSGANIPDSLPVQEKVYPRLNIFLESNLRLLNWFTWKNSAYRNYPFYMGKLFHNLDHSIRKRLRKIIPDFLENRTLDQHKQIIEQEIGDFYRESNIKTSNLIGIDLKKYDY